MAARLNRVRQYEIPWRFYVYELLGCCGECLYIGKGSGNRLSVQKRVHGIGGREIARFRRETDAYAFEVKQIAERVPTLNKHRGGNGSKVASVYTRRDPWVVEMDRVGTEVYAARFLIERCLKMVDPSKVDNIRRVAYG